MPTASRAERRKRRIKRNNTLLKASLKRESIDRFKTHALLMAVLAQKGGEATVTEGTLKQVVDNIRNLGYTVIKGETDGEFIVRMTEAATPEQVEPPTEDTIVEGALKSPDRETLMSSDTVLVTRYDDPDLGDVTEAV